MTKFLTISTLLVVICALASPALARRAAVGPRGGAVAAGPRGAVAVGPRGNVAVRGGGYRGGYYGGGYRGYGVGAAAVGAAAVGAAAAGAAYCTQWNGYAYVRVC
jgi:hypothetical protein